MATTVKALAEDSLGKTQRKDAWWLEPLFYICLFGGFTVYATWAALNPTGPHGEIYYQYGPYLSPFFSPYFNPEWLHKLPALLATPALLILWAPGGFRGTCYYSRKAYYRSVFMDPPGCAVGESCGNYKGETRFFLFQNLHRYFLYVAILFIFILSWDALLGLIWPVNGIGADGQSVAGPSQFGLGLGTLVMALNAYLLAGYTLGCHAFRHLVGGGLDFLRVRKNNPVRFALWKVVTRLNEKHMQWALVSMIWVGLTDLYIRLCAMGVIHDIRIF
jgi:hypothetical protein